MIERQLIVTWYKPDEKTPLTDTRVVVTVSGKARNIILDHALETATWFGDGLGWDLEGYPDAEFTVHAWADLDPYGG